MIDLTQLENDLSSVRDFLDRIASVERDAIDGRWAMRHAKRGIEAIDRALGRVAAFDPIHLGC